MCFHFTWLHSKAPGGLSGVKTVAVRAVEQALQPFGARRHTGKVFTLKPAEFWSVYGLEQVQAFDKFAHSLDPNKKFSNEFTQQYIYDSLSEAATVPGGRQHATHGILTAGGSGTTAVAASSTAGGNHDSNDDNTTSAAEEKQVDEADFIKQSTHFDLYIYWY